MLRGGVIVWVGQVVAEEPHGLADVCVCLWVSRGTAVLFSYRVSVKCFVTYTKYTYVHRSIFFS